MSLTAAMLLSVATGTLIVQLPGENAAMAKASYDNRPKVTATMTCTNDTPAVCEEAPSVQNMNGVPVTVRGISPLLVYRAPYEERNTLDIYLVRSETDLTVGRSDKGIPDGNWGWAPSDEVINGDARFSQVLRETVSGTVSDCMDGDCNIFLLGASGTSDENWFYSCRVSVKQDEIYAPKTCRQIAIQKGRNIYLPVTFATRRKFLRRTTPACCGERVYHNTWPCKATVTIVTGAVKQLLEQQLGLTTEQRMSGVVGYIPVRASTLIAPYFERGTINVDVGVNGGRTESIYNSVTRQTTQFATIGADVFLTLMVNRQRSGIWLQPSSEQENAYITFLRQKLNAIIGSICGH